MIVHEKLLPITIFPLYTARICLIRKWNIIKVLLDNIVIYKITKAGIFFGEFEGYEGIKRIT